MPNKSIYFDMDGTIASLYQVEDWLNKLRAFDPEPYLSAPPMYDMEELSSIICDLKAQGWTVGVITWLSKEYTPEYDSRVRRAKIKWLNQYLSVELDEVHMIRYGREKYNFADVKEGFLIDDNAGVRESWEKCGGVAINPDETLFQFLRGLVQ